MRVTLPLGTGKYLVSWSAYLDRLRGEPGRAGCYINNDHGGLSSSTYTADDVNDSGGRAVVGYSGSGYLQDGDQR